MRDYVRELKNFHEVDQEYVRAWKSYPLDQCVAHRWWWNELTRLLEKEQQSESRCKHERWGPIVQEYLHDKEAVEQHKSNCKSIGYLRHIEVRRTLLIGCLEQLTEELEIEQGFDPENPPMVHVDINTGEETIVYPDPDCAFLDAFCDVMPASKDKPAAGCSWRFVVVFVAVMLLAVAACRFLF